MKKILNTYKKLNEVKEELKQLSESLKDNPLEQLENFGAESALREEIDELRKTILKDFKNHFESMPTNPQAVEFLNKFKNIDEKSAALQASIRNITASSGGNAALDYLKGLSEIQQDRNTLLEDAVGTITETQPTKTTARKKKM
jgi:hypothetical protein